jgi:DNA invertase Pin-like site-specific DNA recombinase
MPNKYSDATVERVYRDVYKYNPELNIGHELAMACITRNISVAKVAKELGVGRMTVYRWFNGHDIRKKNRDAIKLYLDNLQRS